MQVPIRHYETPSTSTASRLAVALPRLLRLQAETWPSGQGTSKSTAVQLEQLKALEKSTYVPAGQLAQRAAPGTAAYVPAAQFKQLVDVAAPVDARDVPAEQLKQPNTTLMLKILLNFKMELKNLIIQK